ncbi:ankyrin repeat-containing domain protein [Xylariaceae sp. FL1651]|nr:ankyrin repeat-containing domain protein [Xylariaceae sp. FL1651]
MAPDDKNEGSPFNLRTAASHGHADLVELLLDEPNPPYDNTDDRGRTPLILAASGGHPEVVELLLDTEQVDVNHTAEDGSTALKAALAADSAEVAEVLLRDPKIDVGVKVTYAEEWTPLGAASLAGYLKVAKAIAKKLAPEKRVALREKHRGESVQGTPLYLASDQGHTKVVKLLLKDEYLPDAADEKKNYIDERNMGGRTALLAAATNGHADVVDLLLQKNADMDAQSSDGMTPLKAAMFGGHTNVVKLLFAQNKNSNLPK